MSQPHHFPIFHYEYGTSCRLVSLGSPSFKYDIYLGNLSKFRVMDVCDRIFHHNSPITTILTNGPNFLPESGEIVKALV
jgi:hypothetical protein